MTQTKQKQPKFQPFADFRQMPKLQAGTPPPKTNDAPTNGNGHKPEEDHEPNAVLIDMKEGYWDHLWVKPEHFPKDKFGVPLMGRQWRYENSLVFLLVHRRDDTWAVIEPPDKHGKTTPEALYSALNPPGVDAVLGMPTSLLEKLGTLGIYLVIAAALFLLYMMSQGNKQPAHHDVPNAMMIFGYLKAVLG